MKLYEQKETTPLKFYKFFMYIYLPLCAAGGLYSAILIPTFYRNLNWYYIATLAGSIFIVLLSGFMFWGLMRWKKFTFPLITVFLAFCIAMCALNIVYYTAFFDIKSSFSMFGPGFPKMPNIQGLPDNYFDYMMSFVERITTIGVIFSAVAAAVLATLVFIYFYKRRRLFDDVPYTIPPQNGQRSAQAPAYPVYVERFCTACGMTRPAPQYQFCPRCGKKYN
jgi:hypothetical protein